MLGLTVRCCKVELLLVLRIRSNCLRRVRVNCKRDLLSLLHITVSDDIYAPLDQGRSVDATVMDLCVACVSGDIDLTEGAFQQLTSLDAGRIIATWDFL